MAGALAAVVVAAGGSAARAAAGPLEPLARSCQVQRSLDPPPAHAVAYRICSAKVPSFDGTLLDATLTLPARPPRGPLPLVVFLHGFLSSKAEYLSATREGTGPDRGADAYKTVHWNNVWFATRGYAALAYSARGHGDSGGEIGLASKALEVRDTQYLTGLLADGAPSLTPIDPLHVAAIGGSYGGGQTWLLLTTRGAGAREYGTWRSPRGRLVRLAAVVPGFTWTDLLYSLAPNGHDRSTGVVDPARSDTPIGIGKQTLLDGFLASANTRLPQRSIVWLTRFNAGEPYDLAQDPVIPEAKRALTADRSAYFQNAYFAALRAGRTRPVPVLAAQGWTDPIFPAIEAVRMYRRLRAADPRYPIALYLGDFEHLTSLAKVPDFAYWHALGNRLLDHYLRGRGPSPPFDARAAISNCDPTRFGPVVRAGTWDGLRTGALTFDLGGPQATSSRVADPRGPASDPVVLSQERGRGCITTTLPPTAGVAAYSAAVPPGTTLMGLPRLVLRYRTPAPDIELNSRLWDVAPDGTQTLVTRGAYRALAPDPAGAVADYELFGNAWTFAPGHRLLLEVTQDDSSYLRADNIPSAAVIDDARLVLPVRR